MHATQICHANLSRTVIEEVGEPRSVERIDPPPLVHPLLERVDPARKAGQEAAGDARARPPVGENGDEGDEEEELLDDGEPPGCVFCGVSGRWV